MLIRKNIFDVFAKNPDATHQQLSGLCREKIMLYEYASLLGMKIYAEQLGMTLDAFYNNAYRNDPTVIPKQLATQEVVVNGTEYIVSVESAGCGSCGGGKIL